MGRPSTPDRERQHHDRGCERRDTESRWCSLVGRRRNQRWQDEAKKNFYAHDLTSSTIKNLYIENTPVQAVSVDGADGLTITEGGHNTDGFDIGDRSDVTITGATVYNQDDCVAVNSGTVCIFSESDGGQYAEIRFRTLPSAADFVPVVTASRSDLLVVDPITRSSPLPSRVRKLRVLQMVRHFLPPVSTCWEGCPR